MTDTPAPTTPVSVNDLQPTDLVFVQPWLGEHCSAGGIKQVSLARAMRIDQSVIHLWVMGRRPVPHNRLSQLAQALNVCLADLLGHAQITADVREIARRAAAQSRVPPQKPAAERVKTVLSTVVVADVQDSPPAIPPSEYPLRWCDSSHGTGPVVQRHHHGPAPSWASRVVTRIEDMA